MPPRAWPLPTTEASRPLDTVRVLSFEQFGAGPWSTLQFADLGAEVIKVEDPATGGDVGRYVPPYQSGENSLFFETFNRNKKSISLDLRRTGARGVLEDVVAAVDVVFSNLRGDQPEKLGLTYEQLRHVNPRIVCCSLSAFGTSGPRAAEGGYDHTLQALTGWMSLTGGPDDPPTKSGLSLVDFSAGYVATIATLVGLWRARETGVGCDCDVSLFDTALAELTYVGTWAATEGYIPPRQPNSAHPSVVPFQSFETSDGWIVVACPKPAFWARLCAVIGRPELQDGAYADFAARSANRDDLLSILEPIFRSASNAEWLSRLAAAGVPAAPVNDLEAALSDPQATARESIIEIDHPELGVVRHIASPLRVGHVSHPRRRAPYRGEHTEDVLRDLCGYSTAEIEELRDAGVFGEPAVVQG